MVHYQSNETMKIPIWYDDPTILLNKEYIVAIWPSPEMLYEEKINAMTRLIILLIFIGLLLTRSLYILLVGLIAIVCITFLYKTKMNKESFTTVIGTDTKTIDRKNTIDKKNMDKNKNIVHPETLQTFLQSDFEKTTKNNPFGNVLLTEIQDDPLRKSAAPSFNVDVHNDITSSVKKMVQKLNPGIKNTNKQLFGDLGEKFNLDQSNRSFFSTANTRIPNDQGAFANFLYGDMPSCKDGDPFACVRDNPRYNLY